MISDEVSPLSCSSVFSLYPARCHPVCVQKVCGEGGSRCSEGGAEVDHGGEKGRGEGLHLFSGWSQGEEGWSVRLMCCVLTNCLVSVQY